MRRRTVIGGLACGLVAMSGSVPAQQSTKLWRIGLLSAIPRESLIDLGRYDAFLQGMRELGYVEGRNFVIEGRYADANYERLPALAAELVRLKVDVIIATPSPAIRAARDATADIPIVFPTTGDPIGSGFATTLARPGRNLTGLANSNLDISIKTLELLTTMVPKLARVAILANPGSATQSAMLRSFGNAASRFGVKTLVVEASTPEDIDKVFTAINQNAADAVIIAADGFLNMQVRQIANLAIKSRLPSITQTPVYARQGGLMSYGEDLTESYRRAATYVDKILKGAKPGDLPIEQPATIKLLINLRTAKALGLTVPQSLLSRADELLQ